MKIGHQVFFYHNNEGLAVMGIAKVEKTAYPDPTADDVRWVGVELTPFKALKKPVTLTQVKGDVRLKDIALVRIGRLSVMPLKKEEYNVILELSK